MKRLFLFFLLALNMAMLATAHAEKADSTKPANFEADRMDVDDVKQIRTLSGNVILTRGSMVLKADRMVVTEDPSGYQFATLYAAAGTVATFRQKRDGGENLWMEGQAERIEYDSKTELVKLISKAKMRRLEGSKPSDEVEGEFISYDSRAEFFSVNNTTSGTSKPGAGRIKGVFQPTTDQKGK